MIPTIDVYATGQNIRAMLKAQGITTTEVKDLLCLCSHQAIYKWYRGESLPNIDNLVALSRLLGVKVDDILVMEGGD